MIHLFAFARASALATAVSLSLSENANATGSFATVSRFVLVNLNGLLALATLTFGGDFFGCRLLIFGAVAAVVGAIGIGAP